MRLLQTESLLNWQKFNRLDQIDKKNNNKLHWYSGMIPNRTTHRTTALFNYRTNNCQKMSSLKWIRHNKRTNNTLLTVFDSVYHLTSTSVHHRHKSKPNEISLLQLLPFFVQNMTVSINKFGYHSQFTHIIAKSQLSITHSISDDFIQLTKILQIFSSSIVFKFQHGNCYNQFSVLHVTCKKIGEQEKQEENSIET